MTRAKARPGRYRDACLPWDLDIPGLEPEAARGLANPAAFAAGLADLAARLPEAQPWARSDPRRVASLEQDLERDLIALILAHFGPVTVLAEEHFNSFGGYACTASQTRGGLSFAVDPLDGSKCFALGSPTYAVSVAGCLDGRPVFGFVYQPSSGTLYSAARTAGAYAGRRRLVASPHSVPRLAAVRSGTERDPVVQAAVANLRRKSYQLERMECTSLKFCWLAEGLRAGLVKRLVERDDVLCIWGTAAGQLIAEEAGVGCIALDGGPWQWAAGAVAAGDPRFLADLFPSSDHDRGA